MVIGATKVITRDVPDEDDSPSLPSLKIKVEGDDENNVGTMQKMLDTPPSSRRTTTNDDTTISSSLTMDTRMDAVKASMGSMEYSVNYMNHTFKISWRDKIIQVVIIKIKLVKLRIMSKNSVLQQVLRSFLSLALVTRLNKSVDPG